MKTTRSMKLVGKNKSVILKIENKEKVRVDDMKCTNDNIVTNAIVDNDIEKIVSKNKGSDNNVMKDITKYVSNDVSNGKVNVINEVVVGNAIEKILLRIKIVKLPLRRNVLKNCLMLKEMVHVIKK